MVRLYLLAPVLVQAPVDTVGLHAAARTTETASRRSSSSTLAAPSQRGRPPCDARLPSAGQGHAGRACTATTAGLPRIAVGVCTTLGTSARTMVTPSMLMTSR